MDNVTAIQVDVSVTVLYTADVGTFVVYIIMYLDNRTKSRY